MESVGLLDMAPSTLNSMASTLFNDVIANIVAATCTVYYYCTQLNVADLIGTEIDAMQSDLKTGFFDGMFPLLFMAVGFSGAAWLLRRNFIQLSSELGYALAVVVLASLLGRSATSLITACDSISLAMSESVAASINGSESEDAVIQGIWKSMVIAPWESLNLGASKGDQKYQDLVKIPANTEERQEAVDELIKDKGEEAKAVFGKARAGSKFGSVLIYLIPALLKCLLYLAFGGIRLGLRLAIVLLVLCGIFVLALSLVPQLGGKGLLFKWIHLLANCMVLSVLVTFLFSFIMKIDAALFNAMGPDGWLIVILLQCIIMLLVVLFHKQIIGLFTKIAKDTRVMSTMGAGATAVASGAAIAGGQIVSTGALIRDTLAGAGDAVVDSYAEHLERRQNRQTQAEAATYAAQATPEAAPAAGGYGQSTEAPPPPDNVIRLSDYRAAAAAQEPAAAEPEYDPSYKAQPVYLSRERQAAAMDAPAPALADQSYAPARSQKSAENTTTQQIRRVTTSE